MTAQEGPKTAQEGPETAQEASKTAQEAGERPAGAGGGQGGRQALFFFSGGAAGRPARRSTRSEGACRLPRTRWRGWPKVPATVSSAGASLRSRPPGRTASARSNLGPSLPAPCSAASWPDTSASGALGAAGVRQRSTPPNVTERTESPSSYACKISATPNNRAV